MNPTQRLMETARIKRELKDDYRAVFLLSKEGLRVLTDLLHLTMVTQMTYVQGSPEETAFNAGKQSIGLALLELVDKSGYEAIIEMERKGAELTKIGEDYEL